MKTTPFDHRLLYNITQVTVIKTTYICNLMILVIWHFLYFCHSLGHIWNILGPILGVFIILIFGIAVYCKKKSKGVVFRKSEIPHSRLVNEPAGAFECFLIYFHVFQKKLPVSLLSYFTKTTLVLLECSAEFYA